MITQGPNRFSGLTSAARIGAIATLSVLLLTGCNGNGEKPAASSAPVTASAGSHEDTTAAARKFAEAMEAGRVPDGYISTGSELAKHLPDLGHAGFLLNNLAAPNLLTPIDQEEFGAVFDDAEGMDNLTIKRQYAADQTKPVKMVVRANNNAGVITRVFTKATDSEDTSVDVYRLTPDRAEFIRTVGYKANKYYVSTTPPKE